MWPDALDHEHSSLLLYSHDNRGEETTKLSPGCNLAIAQTASPDLLKPGEEMDMAALTLHSVQNFTPSSDILSVPFKQLKLQKTPKEKRKKVFLTLWRNTDSFGLNNE